MVNPELGHGETIRGLVRGILTDIRTLIHEEIALARVEIRDQAGRARAAAISFGMAAAALLFAGTFLLIALATAIADSARVADLGRLLAVAVRERSRFITLSSGRTQLKNVLAVPPETMSTLKENSECVAQRLSSNRNDPPGRSGPQALECSKRARRNVAAGLRPSPHAGVPWEARGPAAPCWWCGWMAWRRYRT